MPLLSDDALHALCEARHPDPFAVLGAHRIGAQQVLRVCLPGARSVAVVDYRGPTEPAPPLTLQRCGDSPVFEGCWPSSSELPALAAGPGHPAYRLQVYWDSGAQGCYADAYSFGCTLSPTDVYYLGEGSHLRPYTVLGAHPLALHGVAGVRFAVWAPNAQRVSVVGSFNAWDARRHPMRLHPGAGVWEIFIPHAGPGDLYKFELRSRDGEVLPAKADPYAFRAQLRPDTASVVQGMPPPRALPAARHAANQREAPIAIYEVHLGSWRRHADGRWLSWQELADSLPAYAAELGFTHLELLPVTEHPFDGSWGYQPLGLFAPTARFGPPEGFGSFIDACHARGLGVLLDWVPAHFPTDAAGLARFDGSALYEYADAREGFHRDWNTAIYNFGRTEVRNFLVGNALFWLERHGLDGLRVDAVASMLYRDYSRAPGEWLPNVHGGRENLEAIALLQQANIQIGAHAPGAITVAEESTAFAGVSRPVHAGGLGFHYKWNMGWMHDTLDYMRRDPAHRRWHHQQLSFGLMYAWSENFVLPLSHDEVVHGKGSLLGKMPGDRWQQLANLRAYYAFMWAHPGKKLLFMGAELAQPTEWNHDASLPWQLLEQPEHRGVHRLVRDLNQALRSRPALHRYDCEPQGFEWVDANDSEHSVLTFLRRAGTQWVLVICNFTPLPRLGYRVGVPAAGPAWREILNTDSQHYGGSNLGNGSAELAVQPEAAHGRPQSLWLTLPPLATLYLEPVAATPEPAPLPPAPAPPAAA